MSEHLGRTNVTNRLNGNYQAEVVDVNHPDDLYLAKIRLINLWSAVPDADLPWAEFMLPIGAKASSGRVIPVEPGELVWVDFPRKGDTRYPRITGGLYHAPDNQSQLPDEVNGKPYDPKRAEGEPSPPAYVRADELYDRFGLREHRTAKGGYSLTHKATGTAFEFTESGDVVVHAEGNAFESSTGDKKEQYKGSLTIIVKGDATIKSDGAATVESGGDLTLKAGGGGGGQAGGNFAVVAKAAPWKLG
ncbi:phage baseplate assembly protein V [Vibrio fluvialis]|uniref:phage baseplate assembly protein V n=1 Tax=Vibrio fluvialis TaxID=676 RepID=UPI001EEB0FDC|nr:phage baseplate assembly protein V [Vibrio fluvialis]MCG6418897.1 phage baseplate assembly protein V [Vibrio fluvialis]